MSTSPKVTDLANSLQIEPIMTVKYSLPELLAELKHERATGVLAMEKLQQADIGNLFLNKQRRSRGKPQ
jgi:hypothetical protein